MEPLKFVLYQDGRPRNIIITEVNYASAAAYPPVTGVFKLSEGETGLGNIVFDDKMHQWEYTGMGNLSHDEAAWIATFIKDHVMADAEPATKFDKGR